MSKILFDLEMVEEKYDTPDIKPKKRAKKEDEPLSIFKQLACSIYYPSMITIMDLVLCVLRRLIELRKLGVFSSDLIKNMS